MEDVTNTSASASKKENVMIDEAQLAALGVGFVVIAYSSLVSLFLAVPSIVAQ